MVRLPRTGTVLLLLGVVGGCETPVEMLASRLFSVRNLEFAPHPSMLMGADLLFVIVQGQLDLQTCVYTRMLQLPRTHFLVCLRFLLTFLSEYVHQPGQTADCCNSDNSTIRLMEAKSIFIFNTQVFYEFIRENSGSRGAILIMELFSVIASIARTRVTGMNYLKGKSLDVRNSSDSAAMPVMRMIFRKTR